MAPRDSYIICTTDPWKCTTWDDPGHPQVDGGHGDSGSGGSIGGGPPERVHPYPLLFYALLVFFCVLVVIMLRFCCKFYSLLRSIICRRKNQRRNVDQNSVNSDSGNGGGGIDNQGHQGDDLDVDSHHPHHHQMPPFTVGSVSMHQHQQMHVPFQFPPTSENGPAAFVLPAAYNVPPPKYSDLPPSYAEAVQISQK